MGAYCTSRGSRPSSIHAGNDNDEGSLSSNPDGVDDEEEEEEEEEEVG
jgi:hypothetical protein